VVFARVAKSLNDCPSTKQSLPSIKINRSCSVRGAAIRISRVWLHLLPPVLAAGFSDLLCVVASRPRPHRHQPTGRYNT